MAEITHHTIENIFSYHSPTPNQAERYGAIRSGARELAYLVLEDSPGDRTTMESHEKMTDLIVGVCPASRERSVSIRYLERVISPSPIEERVRWLQSAVMWANASIAINEPDATAVLLEPASR